MLHSHIFILMLKISLVLLHQIIALGSTFIIRININLRDDSLLHFSIIGFIVVLIENDLPIIVHHLISMIVLVT